MPDSFSTSFIPKKVDSGRPRRKASWLDVFRAIAVIIFVLALILGVGVFLYQQLLNSSISRKQAALERAKQAFEPQLIQDLARLDTRLAAAQLLLKDHLAPTKLFSLLENTTLQTVRFNSLSYQEANGMHTLNLNGEARSFASVALQSDEFGNNQFIENPVFGGLQVNNFGRINFEVSANLAPSLFTFAPTVTSATETPTTTPVAASTTPTVSTSTPTSTTQ